MLPSRDQTQSAGFKVLVVAIIFVLVLFGFGATNIFSVGILKLQRLVILPLLKPS